MARATLWRMERGDSRCHYKLGDVGLLGRLYGADRDSMRSLVSLARATRTRSWVVAYQDVLPEGVATSVDLESYASHICCYAAGVVPDLLQHEAYARALGRASRRMGNVCKLTRFRLHRQAILTRRPVATTFEFVLEEAVLYRSVGGARTMIEQHRRLREYADLPNVTIRIVSHRAGPHPGLGANSFEILEFPTDDQFSSLPTTVCFSGLGEYIVLDNSREVGRYREYWKGIDAHALDEMASKRLVDNLLRRREYRSVT